MSPCVASWVEGRSGRCRTGRPPTACLPRRLPVSRSRRGRTRGRRSAGRRRSPCWTVQTSPPRKVPESVSIEVDRRSGRRGPGGVELDGSQTRIRMSRTQSPSRVFATQPVRVVQVPVMLTMLSGQHQRPSTLTVRRPTGSRSNPRTAGSPLRRQAELRGIVGALRRGVPPTVMELMPPPAV